MKKLIIAFLFLIVAYNSWGQCVGGTIISNAMDFDGGYWHGGVNNNDNFYPQWAQYVTYNNQNYFPTNHKFDLTSIPWAEGTNDLYVVVSYPSGNPEYHPGYYILKVQNYHPSITNTFSTVSTVDSNILLSATPTGGVFSGPGVSGTTFSPSLAGAGTHTIVYTYTINWCSFSTSKDITVTLPTITNFTDITACSTDAAIPLNALPAGGVYSGTGVTGSSFDPGVAGVGTHPISYAIGGVSKSVDATVVNPPVVSLSSIADVYPDTPVFALSGGSPAGAGGSYFVNGVLATTFSPASSGVGTYTVKYLYSNGSCESSVEKTFKVLPLQVNSIPNMDVCLNDATVQLTESGGTYSIGGTALSGGLFSPVSHGVGIQNVTWKKASFVDANFTINVHANPQIGTTDQTLCITTARVDLTTSITGAASITITGTGTELNQYFNPAVAGPGTHSISITATNAYCNTQKTIQVTVVALPVVSLSSIADVYPDTPVFVLSGGSPAGGSYFVNGTLAATFNPAIMGVGTYTVKYSYSNGTCESSVEKTFKVLPLQVNSIPNMDVCLNDATVQLTESGGTYYIGGTALSGGLFSPVSHGVGTQNVTWKKASFVDANFTINVHANPQIGTTDQTLCITTARVDLTTSITGAANITITGTGTELNQYFNPAVAGPGTHSISITATNAYCSAQKTIQVTVVALPVVSLSPIADVYPDTPVFSLSGGSPAGGSYFVNGVLATTFSPASSGVGTYTVKYLYSNGTCESSVEKTFKVLPLQVNSIPNMDVCLNDATVQLTESGGTYYIGGTALSGGLFSPVSHGVGIQNVTWKKASFADSNFTINVHANPQIGTTDQTLCITTARVDLTTSITGAASITITGTGTELNQYFNPAVAGPGTHSISITATNAYCSAQKTINVTVQGVANLTFSGTNRFCSTSAPVNLSGFISRPNETFSCADGGVTGSMLDPQQLTPGVHTLVYTLQSTLDCSQSISWDFTIIEPSAITLSPFADVYQDTPMFTLSGGSPAGGSYYVDGILRTTFNPATLGVGTHTVKYLYSNGTCESSTDRTLNVLPLRIENISNLDVCLGDAPLALNQNGGTYYINGTALSGGLFSPVSFGVGTQNVTWKKASFADSNFTINVHANPQVGTTDQTLCITTARVDLTTSITGANGIVITGTGAELNQYFNPAVAGPGTHSISITATNAYCSAQKTINVTVQGVSGLAFSGLDKFCSAAAPVDLSGFVNYPGGTFSCADGGITGNTLNPQQLTEGIHTLIYTLPSSSSCSQSISSQFTVVFPSTVALSSFADVYSDTPMFTLSGGSPAGGSYFVNGVLATTFSPASSGVGTYTVKYSYSNATCENSIEKTFKVLPLQSGNGNISNLDVCLNDALTLNENGGTFFIGGTALSGGRFSPASYGVGTQNVTWEKTSFADVNFTINVHANPRIQTTAQTLCITDPRVDLTTNIYDATGITITGTGAELNQYFNPAVAGPGTHSILITATNANCSTQKTIQVTVPGIANLAFKGLGNFCSSSASVDLSSFVGYPGGTFSCPDGGITGNMLNPQQLKEGKHTLVYTLQPSSGCSQSISGQFTITSIPEVSLSSFADVYADAPVFTLSGGSPAGGSYFVNGVLATTIDPAALGIGSYTVKYLYTSGTCQNSIEKTLKILPAIVTLKSVSYCKNSDKISLVGNPIGGQFLINNEPASILDPSKLNLGINKVSYTCNNKQGVAVTSLFEITINAVPEAPQLQLKSAYCPGDYITLQPSNYNSDYQIFVKTPQMADKQKADYGTSYKVDDIGAINITYLNGSGCYSESKTFNVNIETREPNVSISSSNIKKGELLQIKLPEPYDYISSFEWLFSDGVVSYDAQPLHYFNVPGFNSVDLKYTTQSGCTFSKSFTNYVYVQNTDNLVTSSKLLEEGHLKVYPNPSEGQVNLDVDFEGKYDVQIFNSIGMNCKEIKGLQGNSKFDLSNFTPGSYVLKISLRNQPEPVFKSVLLIIKR